MIYVVYGFLFGFVVPYIARRFQKFMPATLAYGLVRIFKPVKRAKKSSLKKKILFSKYFWRSFMYGLVTASLSGLAFYHFGALYIWWCLAFFWLLLLLAEIDWKMQLLPDILTYPLLLLGLVFSMFAGQWVGIGESVIGAFVGYFLPIIVSLFFVWKKSDAFGGGDIKVLSAIGAWIGFEGLLYAVILSTVLFFVEALIRRKRIGAYGLSIAIASIAVAFYCF